MCTMYIVFMFSLRHDHLVPIGDEISREGKNGQISSSYRSVVLPISIYCNTSLGIQSPCQMMIGVYNHLLIKVFRLHFHSQKVIGSLGRGIPGFLFTGPLKASATSLSLLSLPWAFTCSSWTLAEPWTLEIFSRAPYEGTIKGVVFWGFQKKNRPPKKI